MDYKVALLEESLTAYEKENELFDRKKFDDVQVLSVVFKAMDLVKNLDIPVVSQQREQLAAFYEHLYDIDKPLRYGNGYKEADDFIAANCG